ncbi:DUF3947 family protein [Bacillus cereus]|uniref:Uncharacterized protein n=1 Tax=Bacillus cereus VD118 TaxID=1053231 RepID=R8QEW4_BACCE|nr:DUF3947 family protein [Bacillus cereus]EOP68948.1 hypothetical protein IIQ_02201 [Bacillus cereus VD118]
MLCNYFYNETQMRPLGGQGPAQSTIQAVHQAIQAQQQALQAQQQALHYKRNKCNKVIIHHNRIIHYSLIIHHRRITHHNHITRCRLHKNGIYF